MPQRGHLTKLLAMRKISSTNFKNEKTLTDFCNASKTLRLITGRWKLSILFSLLEKNQRTFSEFKQLLPTVSDRILALQLRQLVDDLIVTKETKGTSVTYTLTSKGEALQNILKSLAVWQLH